MIVIDILLFGLVAGLIGIKVAVLAAAAILFIRGLAGRARQRKIASTPVGRRRGRQHRLDVHA